jgi:hypothetical protein
MGLSIPCLADASNIDFTLGPVLYFLRHMAVAGWDIKIKRGLAVPGLNQIWTACEKKYVL